jgi:ATP-dependent DNA helicase DinG
MHTKQMINSLRLANFVTHEQAIHRFKNGELSPEFSSYAETIGPLAIALNNRISKILQQLIKETIALIKILSVLPF